MRVALPWFALASFACAESTSGTADSGTPTDTADSGIAPVTTWYTGVNQGQTPDGSYVADPEALLFIRTLDAETATVTEEVWTEGKPKWSHYLLVHAVSDDRLTFTSEFVTPDGTLDVVGGFDAGEAWAWTAWHSTSTYRDGIYLGTVVESEDTVANDGVATAHKVVLDATGTATWDITETLTPTTEAEFTTALADVKWE